MTKQERAARALDGTIVVLVVAVLFVWAGNERGSEEGATAPSGSTVLQGAIARPDLIRRGTRLALPAFPSHDGVRNVFLLVSATCAACNESIPLYRDLGDYARTAPGWRFVIATTDDVETIEEWAVTHGIRHDVLMEMRDAVSLGFTLTPTLLLTEDDGAVTDVLLRRLSPEEESMLWRRLRRPDSVLPLSNAGYAAEIGGVEFEELMRTQGERVIVVDVRSRADYQASGVGRAATNIPINELAVRGPVELLGRTAPEKVVVDCTSIDWVRCRRAGRILDDIGMENPSLLIP